MNRPKLALVKWLKGVDKETYTPGVPINWIRNFDVEEFNSCEDPNVSYVVEWRDGEKPKEGWKCYDAVVVQVSEQMSILEKTLKIMKSKLSLKKVTILSETNQNSEKNIQKLKQRKQLNNDDDMEIFEELIPKNKTIPVKRNIDETLGKHSRDDSTDSESDEDSVPIKKRKQLKKNEVSSNNLDVILKEFMKIQEILIKINENIEQLKPNTNCKCADAPDSDEKNVNFLKEKKNLRSASKKLKPNMIEVGTTSGLHITQDQWEAAISKPTFTTMGVSLLMSMFSKKDLLTSSLNGGTIKRTKNGQKVTNKALDKDKVADLINAVKKRHPDTFNETTLNEALRHKLSSLRAKHYKEDTDNSSEADINDEANTEELSHTDTIRIKNQFIHFEQEIEKLKQVVDQTLDQCLKTQIDEKSAVQISKNTKEDDKIAGVCEKIPESIRQKFSGIKDVFKTNRYLQNKAQKAKLQEPLSSSISKNQWALLPTQNLNKFKLIKSK